MAASWLKVIFDPFLSPAPSDKLKYHKKKEAAAQNLLACATFPLMLFNNAFFSS